MIKACPGNCQDADKIAFLQEKFPQLEIGEITGKMKEVKDINDRMIKNKIKPEK